MGRLETQLERTKLRAGKLQLLRRRQAPLPLLAARTCRGGGSNDLRRRLCLGQHSLEHQTAIAILADRLRERLKLQLDALNHLEVGLELGRKLPRKLLPVGFEPLLLLDQTVSCILKLHLEKLVGAFSKRRAVAQVLLDEERREALRDALNGPGICAGIR